MTQSSASVPVLWHLKVSNFNEKARWALDYKRVPHVRRAVYPGAHRRIAAKLTAGTTFPILVLDGRRLGDSTEIIAALEHRHPTPALYPSEGGLRRRALELEDFFDEQLGPYMRRLVVAHLLPHPALMLSTFAPDLPPWRRAAARVAFPLLRRGVRASQGIDEPSVSAAFEKVKRTGERFSSCLSESGYLAGDAFSVADLTLASLVAPAVCPEEFPYAQPQRDHPALAPVRQSLIEWGILEWTRQVYRRHRGGSAEVS